MNKAPTQAAGKIKSVDGKGSQYGGSLMASGVEAPLFDFGLGGAWVDQVLPQNAHDMSDHLGLLVVAHVATGRKA